MVALVMSAGAGLLGAFFAYMYGLKRQPYLLAWSGAWVLVALQSVGRGFDASQNLTPWQEPINEWLMAAAALVFLCSVQLYSRRPAWVRSAIIAAIAAAVWAEASYLGHFPVPLRAGTAVVLLGIGGLFWHEGKKQDSRADLFLGIAFFGWSVYCWGPPTKIAWLGFIAPTFGSPCFCRNSLPAC